MDPALIATIINTTTTKNPASILKNMMGHYCILKVTHMMMVCSHVYLPCLLAGVLQSLRSSQGALKLTVVTAAVASRIIPEEQKPHHNHSNHEQQL